MLTRRQPLRAAEAAVELLALARQTPPSPKSIVWQKMLEAIKVTFGKDFSGGNKQCIDIFDAHYDFAKDYLHDDDAALELMSDMVDALVRDGMVSLDEVQIDNDSDNGHSDSVHSDVEVPVPVPALVPASEQSRRHTTVKGAVVKVLLSISGKDFSNDGTFNRIFDAKYEKFQSGLFDDSGNLNFDRVYVRDKGVLVAMVQEIIRELRSVGGRKAFSS
jgi:hypothetical protein